VLEAEVEDGRTELLVATDYLAGLLGLGTRIERRLRVEDDLEGHRPVRPGRRLSSLSQH
jgi:hypothetical protein